MEIATVDSQGHEKTRSFIRMNSFTTSFTEANQKLKNHEIVKIKVKYAGYAFTISMTSNGVVLNGTIPRALLPVQGHGSISLSDSGMMAVDFQIPETWLYGGKQ